MEKFIIAILSAWLFTAGIYRLFVRWKKVRGSTVRADRRSRIRAGMVAASVLLLTWGIMRGASIFLEPEAVIASRYLSFALIFTGVMEVASLLRFPVRNESRGRLPLIKNGAMLVVSLAVFLVVLHMRSLPGPDSRAIRMLAPFRGQWRVITGGAPAMINYHHDNPSSQNYAIDFIFDGPYGSSRGKVVYAPIDGKIIKAVGHIKKGEVDPPEGNFIIIRTEDGSDVWLAHLQEDSLLVEEGDMVAMGQMIAACGATGGADLPHIHLHAEKDGLPLPIRMGPRSAFLIKGDVVNRTMTSNAIIKGK